MTPSELKHNVEKTGSNFFDRSSMKFFGDTMKNYGCISGHLIWILHRKRPVKHGLRSNAYFCKETFKRIYL